MYSNDSAEFANGFIAGQNGARNDGGFGFGDGWSGIWGIIILAMIFGWGNGGWGGFGGFGGGNGALQGALTRSDLCAEFNANDLQNAVRGVQQGICDSTFALNNTVVNGFSNVARDMCTGFTNVAAGITENRFANQQCCCSIERAIDNSRFDTQTGFNALSSQLASCCCDIRSGLKDVQFQNATDTCAIQTSLANNTRDIIDSQQAGTRAILDWLCAKETADLRAENQNLKLAASQERQNQYLVSTLRPCPSPAYITCNPFTGTYGGYYGYGNAYNNGCGCNSGCGC